MKFFVGTVNTLAQHSHSASMWLSDASVWWRDWPRQFLYDAKEISLKMNSPEGYKLCIGLLLVSLCLGCSHSQPICHPLQTVQRRRCLLRRRSTANVCFFDLVNYWFISCQISIRTVKVGERAITLHHTTSIQIIVFAFTIDLQLISYFGPIILPLKKKQFYYSATLA